MNKTFFMPTFLHKMMLMAGLFLCVGLTETFAKESFLLSAEELVHDKTTNTISAAGTVEIVREPYILQADLVSYNQTTGQVTANGHVVLVNREGDTYFGDYLELDSDLKDGFIRNVSIVLADNSRLAARRATRDERFTTLEQAVYSPCKICESNKKPLWQIKAIRVIHDQKKQDIIYHNAWLELFGVPVAYTPYLVHPAPEVERRSGFLTPKFGWDSELGAMVRNYYYWDIAPEQDMVIEGTITSDQGFLLGGNWRRRFYQGALKVKGSLTHAERETGQGGNVVREEDKIRGHLFAEGRFDLTDHWRGGFDVQHVSDETYLRRYEYDDEDILKQRLFVEGFFRRHYAKAEAILVDDLRPGFREEQPKILPRMTFSALGDPKQTLGGRWSFHSGFLGLNKDENKDIYRGSVDVGWQRQFISDTGLLSTLDLNSYQDIYWLRNHTNTSTALNKDQMTARAVPQFNFKTKFPVQRPVQYATALIEPTVAFSMSPNKVDKEKDIPNEDSLDVELDTTNLFQPNRLPGRDRFENGARVAYGIKTGLYGPSGGYTSLFLGQSYRHNDENDIFPTGSGLEENFSDYVGRLQISPGKGFDIDYRLRLDHQSLDDRLHDLTFRAGAPIFNLEGNYLFVNQVEGTGISDSRNELELTARSQFHPNWSVSMNGLQKLGNDSQFLEAGMELLYEDECFLFSFNADRDLTDRIGGTSETSFFFRIGFKTLGQFDSPNFKAGRSSATAQDIEEEEEEEQN